MRDHDDVPYIVIERGGGSQTGTFIMGALLGAGLALLFAPKSGEETQAELKARARQLRDTAEERVRVADQGKPSRTEFQVVTKAPHATWVNAFPHTGRTHQIRVHAAASDNPIVGDSKYRPEPLQGLELELGIGGLCLHAERLVLPFRGGQLKFSCPPPATFTSAWDALLEHE